MLMQWISYFMIFSVLLIFILTYPASGKTDWRFFTTVLILSVLLVTNILWFQSRDDRWPIRNNPTLSLWIINIFTTILVLAAFALTGRGEIVFLLFMQVAQFSVTMGVWPGGAIFSLVGLAAAIAILKGFGDFDRFLDPIRRPIPGRDDLHPRLYPIDCAGR